MIKHVYTLEEIHARRKELRARIAASEASIVEQWNDSRHRRSSTTRFSSGPTGPRPPTPFTTAS